MHDPTRPRGLSERQVALMHALEQAEAAGRWCAASAHLGEISRQSGQIRIRSGDWIEPYLAGARKRLHEHLAEHGSRWPGLTKAQAAILNSIDMHEERGDWESIRRCAERPAFLEMVGTGDASLRDHVSRIIERMATAFLREQEQGPGSLLRRDHPSYVYARQHRVHLEEIRKRLRQPEPA